MRNLLKRFSTRQSMGANYSQRRVGSKSVGTYYATDIHFEVPENEIWVRFAPGMESGDVFNRLCRSLDSKISQGTTYFNTDAQTTHPDISRCTYDPVTNIGTIVFNGTVDCIGQNALSGAVEDTEEVSEIYIPWTVERIDEGAFAGCSRLKSIDLRHTKITEVRDNAFADCAQLQAAYFPNSLRKFGANVFAGDNELIYLDLGGNNSIYDNVKYDMGIDSKKPSISEIAEQNDAIFFTQPIASLAGNSKNLTVRCNRRNLPRYQERDSGSDSTTIVSRPSFIHATSDALTGNATVLCPLNRISSFTRCEDNSDGTPWQETIHPDLIVIRRSHSIYDGPKVFESCEMYHVKNIDFRYRTGAEGMSIYRGNGTIDTPFYIDSSQKELFMKYSSCSPQVKVYANGYGESGAFMYITGYQSLMTKGAEGVLVACDNNHLIYHNGKYFSSVCFGAGAASTIKVYLVHLTHRNAVAELTLSTSGSSATATVEDIQSYHV